MALNFRRGKMIAVMKDPGKPNKILYVDPDIKKVDRVFLTGDTKFEALMDTDTRQIMYVCGASGSGKSTFARGVIQKYNLMFPESPIYVFSRLTEDPAFDDLERTGVITRIPITEDLIENPINIIEDIERNSLVLFDDIDTINDKKLMAQLNNIKLQILEIGRHKNIYCIITSHLINTSDRASTRTIMNEMTSLVIFPRGGGSVYQQKYCLKNYLGFNNKQIDEILNTKDSRWVLLSKNYPQYVLTEKKCYLI